MESIDVCILSFIIGVLLLWLLLLFDIGGDELEDETNVDENEDFAEGVVDNVEYDGEKERCGRSEGVFFPVPNGILVGVVRCQNDDDDDNKFRCHCH